MDGTFVNLSICQPGCDCPRVSLGCAEYLGLDHFLVNTDLIFFRFEEMAWSVHVWYVRVILEWRRNSLEHFSLELTRR